MSDARQVRSLAVIDIDGVVADVRHRLHHLAGRPKDWAAFFAAGSADPPATTGITLVRELAGDHDLCWLTGRPENVRVATESWLATHGLRDGPLAGAPLLMRADDDARPARWTKLEAVRRLAVDRRIGVILDDDPAVIETLRAAGFSCRLADWLPYSDPLRSAQQDDGRT